MTITVELYQIGLFAFGVALYGFAFYWKARRAQKDYDVIAAELEKATFDQVESMRTLSAFRRQYHDGTGALVNEVQKLRREVSRLKRAVQTKKIGKEDKT